MLTNCATIAKNIISVDFRNKQFKSSKGNMYNKEIVMLLHCFEYGKTTLNAATDTSVPELQEKDLRLS